MRFPSHLSAVFFILLLSGLLAQTTNHSPAFAITADISKKWKWSDEERNRFSAALQKEMAVSTAEESAVVAQAALSALKNGSKVDEAVVFAVETRKGYLEALETGVEKKEARREMLQICDETSKVVSKMPLKSEAAHLDFIRERFRTELKELRLSRTGKAALQNRQDENAGQDKNRDGRRNQVHTGSVENGTGGSAGGNGNKGGKP